MQIVTHIGAQCTDGERLLRSLLRNADVLAAEGVAVPGHSNYRRLLREAIQGLAGGPPAPDTREVLLDAILDDREVDRLVMSNPAFICMPAKVFDGGEFYALVGPKLTAMRAMFPEDDLEFHMGLRNPATFVPAIFEQVKGKPFDEFLSGMDPRAILWSDVVDRIREAVPDARLTIWSNEDTPLIWSTLMRSLAGVGPEVELAGQYDLLSTIMSQEGMARFLNYLRTHPPASESQTRRVIAAYLDKYALPEEIEEEIDLPGWDAALVAEMTATYEADVAALAGRGDLRFVAP